MLSFLANPMSFSDWVWMILATLQFLLDETMTAMLSPHDKALGWINGVLWLVASVLILGSQIVSFRAQVAVVLKLRKFQKKYLLNSKNSKSMHSGTAYMFDNDTEMQRSEKNKVSTTFVTSASTCVCES